MGRTAMIIADTNILLRAALNDDPVQSAIARSCLENAAAIVVPQQVICEFAWVMSRSYKLDNLVVIAAVQKLIGDPKIRCDRELILAGLSFLLEDGDFADGVIEFEGRRLGGRVFATFDRQAAAIIRDGGRDCLLLGAS